MNSGGSLKAGLNGGALLTPCDPLGARWIEGVRESYILFPVVVVVVVIVVVFKYIQEQLLACLRIFVQNLFFFFILRSQFKF